MIPTSYPQRLQIKWERLNYCGGFPKERREKKISEFSRVFSDFFLVFFSLITNNPPVVWAKITFAYLWFEKYHLTHLRYVFVTLRNPPWSLSLQKHLLTPKQNITQIKTPKTQTLFERETRGAIRLFFVVWSI